MSSVDQNTFLVRWIAGVERRPKLVLSLAVVFAGLGIALAGSRLQFRTERSDLLSADHPVTQDYQRFRQEFDSEADMIVAVEGPDEAAVVAGVETVASEIERSPALFAKLLYHIDTEKLRQKGLYQLPLAVLKAIETRLEPLRPLLTGVPGGIFGKLAWHGISLETAFIDANRIIDLASPKPPTDVTTQKLVGMVKTLDGLAEYIQAASPKYHSIWNTPIESTGLGPTADIDISRLEIPEYLISPSKKLAVLRVLPVRDTTSFAGVSASVAKLREIAKTVERQLPKIKIGLTGLPILEDDEMQTAMNSSSLAAVVEFLGVMLVFAVGFRALRHPLFVQIGVLFAACWTLGFVTLTVGHLNILSMTFIVTLVGMGVDFGIVWLTRYEVARSRGESTSAANLEAARLVGPGILSGALSTTLAFYAMVCTNFLGIREMGWIAGSGILFCLLAALTIVPALLVVAGIKNVPASKRGSRDQLPMFPFANARPKTVLLLTAVALGFLGWQARFLTADYNLLHLQAKGLESVYWEHHVMRELGTSGWYALSSASNPTQARQLHEQFAQLPEVGQVVEIASLIPSQQQQKEPIIKRIASQLVSVPESLPATIPPTLDRLVPHLLELSRRNGRHPVEEKVVQSAKRVMQVLDRASTVAIEQQLAEFQSAWRQDLLTQLRLLKSAADPRPVTLEDLPTAIVERYLGKTGKWQIQIFPKQEVWDLEPLANFCQALRQVDPHVTGEPITAYHGVLELVASLRGCFVFAGVIIFIATWIDLRNLWATLVAMIPLLLGCVATAGSLAILGVALNPANIIALPLVLGLGVDFGVHVLHDFYQNRPGYFLRWQMGRAMLLTAATTIVGFSALFLSGHWGMISIGIVLSLGVLSCSLLATVVLPAILQLYSPPSLGDSPNLEAPPTILAFPGRDQNHLSLPPAQAA